MFSFIRSLLGLKSDADTVRRLIDTTGLDDLSSLLQEHIRSVISQAALNSPLCILRIRYFSTTAPCTYLELGCVTRRDRDEILAKHGNHGIYYLWDAWENYGGSYSILVPQDPDAASTSPVDRKIKELFAGIYSYLSQDSESNLTVWRRFIQTLSQQLNAVEWNTTCSVTDDFVVVPADGSACVPDQKNDIAIAVPEAKLILLHQRSFIGPLGNLFNESRSNDDVE